MPLYKSPEDLLQIAFRHSFALINGACRNINSRCKSYDNPLCIHQISCLNQFLCTNICPMILEEMLYDREKFSDIQDPRILIAALSSIQMRRFRINTSKDLYIPKSFWTTSISGWKNLISLDLALICTDGILNIVGSSCPNLEIINATSSYKRIQSDFNALLLSRTVTDKGLNNLLQCYRLRKIVIDEPRGKFTHGITCNGIEKLIQNLKHLEEISFSDLGSIIDNSFLKDKSLKLRKITQFRISINKIKAIERVCPYLKCLVLTNFRLDELETYATIEYLAQSDIYLEQIKLSYFSYYPSIDKYFEVKGEHLTCITFIGESDRSIGTKAILQIGIFCPNIVILHVEKLSNCENQLNEVSITREMFLHLKRLTLSGPIWDAEKVIPLCLSHVTHIYSISLTLIDSNVHNFNRYCIENCLYKVIEKNPAIVQSLKTLHLYNSITSSINFIEFMLKKCDLLNLLYVWCEDVIKCKEIQQRLILNNYDMDFQFDLEL